MGASDRLGGNGPLPTHLPCGAADTPALLDLDATIPAKPPSGARSGLRLEAIPPNAGFEGAAHPLSEMLGRFFVVRAPLFYIARFASV
jgi:hypothetical protein